MTIKHSILSIPYPHSDRSWIFTITCTFAVEVMFRRYDLQTSHTEDLNDHILNLQIQRTQPGIKKDVPPSVCTHSTVARQPDINLLSRMYDWKQWGFLDEAERPINTVQWLPDTCAEITLLTWQLKDKCEVAVNWSLGLRGWGYFAEWELLQLQCHMLSAAHNTLIWWSSMVDFKMIHQALPTKQWMRFLSCHTSNICSLKGDWHG